MLSSSVSGDVGFTSIFFCWILVGSLLSLLSTEVSREGTWLPVGEEFGEWSEASLFFLKNQENIPLLGFTSELRGPNSVNSDGVFSQTFLLAM